MRNKKSAILLMFAISLAAFLNGCGSSSKEGSATLGQVAKVGEQLCIGCHATWSEKLTGDPIVANYIASKHNLNNVGCQDCHGGGARHNGVGPIPYPKPNHEQCKTCHGTIADAFAAANHGPTNFTQEVDYNATSNVYCVRCHTHEGAVLSNASGYTGDKDTLAANADKAPKDLTEDNYSSMKCVTCHTTHKTDALRVPKTVDAGGNVVDWQPSITVGEADPSDNKQFNLCTSCHTYTNSDGTLVASGTTASGTKKFYHETAWYRIIATTHYDNPATVGSPDSRGWIVDTPIEGYVLRTKGSKSDKPCLDCHNHETMTNTRQDTDPVRPSTNHTDWAQSAHGGKLLTAKYAAAKNLDGSWKSRSQTTVDDVMAANVKDTPEKNTTWGHYPWNSNTAVVSCQRCHTATGAENFMKNPTRFNEDGTVASGYNLTAPGNDFSHLNVNQRELLYCWGCHSNAGEGVLHKPGAFTFGYKTNNVANGVVVTNPDAGNSNVCMTCHSGRTEVAQNIKNDPRDNSTGINFIYPHYYAISLILFQKGGYEYEGRSYIAPSYFAHDKIGISAAGTGTTSGPCAGCHMSSPNKHLFTNVSKDADGKITGITSTLCATCHKDAYALTGAKLEEEREEYEISLKALAGVLAAKGVYYDFTGHQPYFYTAPYVSGGTNTTYTFWKTPYGSASWKDVMGAAYNLYTLEHTAGFVHNRFYSKRLIWDSIDFINDGTLNDDVATAIDAQATAGRITADEAAAAKKYLGTSRP